MGNAISETINGVKSVIGPVVDPILDVAREVLPLVEDPVKAALPETAGLFETVSKLLGKASPSSSAAEGEQHQALKLIGQLPKTAPGARQGKMLRILELMLEEFSAVI